MKKKIALFVAFAMLISLCFTGCGKQSTSGTSDSSNAVTKSETGGTYTINWKSEPVKYTNFTDLGNYCLLVNDTEYSEYSKALKDINTYYDYFEPAGCTTSCKVNSRGEVIMGRNMDYTVSQYPAYVSRIVGGKYDTVTYHYLAAQDKYDYSQLKELDADSDYLKVMAFTGTDAMNEAGLYVEANARENDIEFGSLCDGTNPGKERASFISFVSLVTANCATVPEALEYIQNSFDWFTWCYDDVVGLPAVWGLAFMMGDAQGNYGLVEFAGNEMRYTPYANGQGNYYIHPDFAEYADNGSGYGRYAATLEHLTECETEEDMLHNMENCMWTLELMDPGCMGYSDFEYSLAQRRADTEEQKQEKMKAKTDPVKDLAIEYHNGNETPLRDCGLVWTTGFNFGVNCHTKHVILRLWEKDDCIIEWQW